MAKPKLTGEMEVFSIWEFLEQKGLVEEAKQAFDEMEAEEALGFLVNLLTKELRAEEEKRWKRDD
jgi:hypothetical protein